ncbi:hypothetical protein SteCoe_25073 [Stentor coeruleus]|uniref:Myb-like DNA-binding domain containing protein n=1 Tax=Stentor coeruleus TaxID=5963 RepID=A0A1R2BGH4_9CILI|nr:hypothetical protein SteCoe_25073 [Stentor coeruleus]
MGKHTAKQWVEKVINIKEDDILKSIVKNYGSKKWKKISVFMSKHKSVSYKSPKQCRDRWVNRLNPELTQNSWTIDEEKLLIIKQKELGNKWSRISKFFIGRSACSIKNHFYSLIRKNIRRYNKYWALGERITDKVADLLKQPKYYNLLVKPSLPKTHANYHKSIDEVLEDQATQNTPPIRVLKPEKVSDTIENLTKNVKELFPFPNFWLLSSLLPS